MVCEHAAAIEETGRIARPVLDALCEMNAFNLQVDTVYGGAQADPITHLRVIEQLSRADGSVGWCAMVGSESSACINAYLQPQVVRDLLGTAKDSVAALTAVGDGRAHEVEDGYRLDGRWRFASGCRHSRWLGALAAVYRDGAPALADSGAPLLRMCYAPAAEAELIDTWKTSGLQGTASDDFVYNDTFVPHERTLDLFGPALAQAPTWRTPASLRFAMSKAAAVCGIARGAMDAVEPLLNRLPFASKIAAREQSRVQMKYAQTHAAIEGGRAYLYQNVERAWQAVQQQPRLTQAQIAETRIAIVFAAQQAFAAIHWIQELGGTAALLDARLDRAVRDMHVARQHLQLQDHVIEDVGRVMLGQSPRNPMF